MSENWFNCHSTHLFKAISIYIREVLNLEFLYELLIRITQEHLSGDDIYRYLLFRIIFLFNSFLYLRVTIQLQLENIL